MSEYSGTSAPRGMEIPKVAADLIEQQQARIDELAATVERLREVINSERKSLMVRVDAEKILQSTPRQNLNEIKRESYREGYSSGWKHSLGTKADDGNHYACGERLAVQLSAQRYPDKE